MKKILWVAQREFLATVLTKGYLVGILFPLAIILLMIVVFPKLMNEKAPHIEGEVAILDPTGAVAAPLTDYLAPETMARRRADLPKKAVEQLPEGMKALAAGAMTEEATKKALEQALGQVPLLQVTKLPAGAEVDSEKAQLKIGSVKDGGRRLALAVIQPDAVVKAEGKDKFGAWDLYIREKLDDRVVDEIRDGLKDSVISARVEKAGLDRAMIESLTQVPRTSSITVGAEGERKTNEVAAVLLPAGFAVLLMMSVMVGGTGLMMSTIEEKSSRVVEVLLSAVSPIELMAGKVLGQMGAASLILVLYASLGIISLFTFAMIGMLDWTLVVFLLLFFVITYACFAAMLGAIGAAVNEVREAQTLQMPVVMSLMLPYIFWFPISRNPNSALAVVLSFLPPANSFTMLLRMTSTSPPPMWQPLLSLVIGAAGSALALWGAAKIFRIGLLQYGKAPDFKTMIRWIRMA